MLGPMRSKPDSVDQPVRTAHMSVHITDTIVVNNTAQNSSDNLPSYPLTIIIAQTLSFGGEGTDREADRITCG